MWGPCLMLDSVSKWSPFCAISGLAATLSRTKLSEAVWLLLKVSSQASLVAVEVCPQPLALVGPYKLLFH